MQPRDLYTYFGDSPEDPYVRFEAFDVKTIKRELDEQGYIVIHTFIPEKRIQSVRDFWLETFAKGGRGRITWAPYLGQQNHIGFSSDTFQHLFRSCDFYWNKPIHDESRQIGLRVNALRNLLLGKDPLYGVRFIDERNGIFMTASYYPADGGFMKPHKDKVAGQESLIHGLIPFTFRGTDYETGGMFLTDRHGVTHDLEADLRPGDAVYYDGVLEHGVARIVPLDGKSVGRLQLSPFPTAFSDPRTNPRALNAVPTSDFVKAKWVCFKNTVRIVLGLTPGLR